MIELTLSDMHCAHCVRTVTETLRRLDPEARVTVDLPSRRVEVETTQSAAAVKAALAEEGYPAG